MVYMNIFYRKLQWPSFDGLYLVDRVSQYPDYLHHQDGYDETKRYGNLKNWPEYNEDIQPIRDTIPVGSEFTVQIIKSPGLGWHVDRNRKVSVLYLIQGEAYTYFKKDNIVHKTMFDKNSWYLFNNDEMHCVEEVQQLRVALCIDLTNEYGDYNTAVKQLGNWL